MEFENIENLNEEQILSLYEDIVAQDVMLAVDKSCASVPGCTLNGRYYIHYNPTYGLKTPVEMCDCK